MYPDDVKWFSENPMYNMSAVVREEVHAFVIETKQDILDKKNRLNVSQSGITKENVLERVEGYSNDDDDEEDNATGYSPTYLKELLVDDESKKEAARREGILKRFM